MVDGLNVSFSSLILSIHTDLFRFFPYLEFRDKHVFSLQTASKFSTLRYHIRSRSSKWLSPL
jgi:hypothetical protein